MKVGFEIMDIWRMHFNLYALCMIFMGAVWKVFYGARGCVGGAFEYLSGLVTLRKLSLDRSGFVNVR